MVNQVSIIKPPLYGTAYWNGVQFEYTPNTGFIGVDYYIYSIKNGFNVLTYKAYVNTGNVAPTTNDVSFTVNDREILSIDLSQYSSDLNGTPLKIHTIDTPIYGDLTIVNNTIVQYKSYGFNAKDELNYTITDGQYYSTSKLTISTINANELEIPDYIKDDIDQLKSDTEILLLSSNSWNNAYTLISGNSAKWNNLNPQNYEDASTIVEQNSANWNTMASKVSGYDIIFSTVSSSSALWDSTQILANSISSNLSSQSGNWNNAFNILSSNSANWNVSYNSYQTLNTVLTTNSANWNNTYNIVSSNSALWDVTNLTNLISSKSGNWENSFNLLSSNSANWDSSATSINGLSTFIQSKSGNWDAAYNTVSSNSANWDNTSIRSLLASNSASWVFTYNTLTAQSGVWNNNTNNLNNLTTSYSSKSAGWTDTETFVRLNSAAWGGSTVTSVVQNNSGFWQNSYTTVQANSTTWNNVSSVYLKYDVAYNVLTANSANWDNYYTTVTSNSSNWNSTYNTVTTSSATWLSGASNTDLVTNNMTVCGNAVFYGSLTADGSSTYLQTEVQATSSFSVVNVGSVNALNVSKSLTLGAIANFQYNNNSVLYVSPVSTVGINTSSPNQALTVVGNISCNGIIYGKVPDSFMVFQNVSGNYETSYTYVTSNSASINSLVQQRPNYNNAFNFVSANSASISNIALSTNNFNSAFNVVTSQSAANNNSYSFLTGASANVGVDQVFRNRKTAYDQTSNYVSLLSSTPAQINFTFDGGGSLITTNTLVKPYGIVQIPSAIDILSWTILADNATTCSVKILTATYSTYPTFGNIISDPQYNIALNNANKATSTTTGWVSSIPQNFFLKFQLDSNTAANNITIALKCNRKF